MRLRATDRAAAALRYAGTPERVTALQGTDFLCGDFVVLFPETGGLAFRVIRRVHEGSEMVFVLDLAEMDPYEGTRGPTSDAAPQ